MSTNVVSQASNVSIIAWWVAFGFTLAATVIFFALSYIRNVKPEARLVRARARARPRAPRRPRTSRAASALGRLGWPLCRHTQGVHARLSRPRSLPLLPPFHARAPAPLPPTPRPARRSTTW